MPVRRVGSVNRTVLPVRPSLQDAALWFIVLTLAITTLLHYLTDVQLIPSHSIYRSLYYLPIAVAAVRYGRRGGVITALTASLLYIPHVLLSWEMMQRDGINDLLENLVFLFVGAFAGTLADAERAQRQRAQAVSEQLVAANSALQSQAMLAEQMRASIASILESIDSGVLTLDHSGRVTTINRAAQALLSRSGSGIFTLPRPIRDYVADGAQGYRQISLDQRHFGLHGSPFAGADGQPMGIVLVDDDLTEQCALEEQMQRAQRLASLGRLAGGLAHEIRNPLAITRAAAQMVQRELTGQPALGEYTQVIQTEIDRVDRLLEQLLAYARPVPLQRGPIEVAALIERTLTLTRAYAAQRGVAISSHVPNQLQSLHGDAEQLHQVLVNLLLNGIHASEPAGEVTIEAAQDVGALTLSVRDTGRGIAPSDLPQIFDPFFSTKIDGTGLGLSIVQQIVHEHGGTVEAHSQLGEGSQFVVRLPA